MLNMFNSSNCMASRGGVQLDMLSPTFHCKWQNFNAKLSDFGLAKDGPTGENSHVSTRVMGTFGYAAPEYMATGTLNLQLFVHVHLLFKI